MNHRDASRRRCGARGESLIRILRLARRIEGARYLPSLAELADEFGVHPRTVRRDLYALEYAGYPVPAWRLNERLAARSRAADLFPDGDAA